MQSLRNLKILTATTYFITEKSKLKHFKAIRDILTLEKFIENAHTCIKTENLCLLSVYFFNICN